MTFKITQLLVIFFLTILLITLQVKAQWIKLNSGTTMGFSKVDFPTEDVGYLRYNGKQLYKTTDGGNTWDTTSTIDLTPGSYYLIDFPSVNTGFIAKEFTFTGPLMLVLKTTDGAATWDTFLVSNSVLYISSFIVDANTGYFLGRSIAADTIFKTTNGGSSFDTLSISFPTGDTLVPYVIWKSLYFLNADTGFAVTDSGKMARTFDGGVNWDTINTGTTANLNYVFFPTNKTGYLMTTNWILKTIDGGDTWFQLPIVVSAAAPSMFFVNADTGYVIMDSTIRKTTDGGFSWMIQPSGNTEYLWDITFVNDNTGYAVGNNGTILKTTNGGEPTGIDERNKGNIDVLIYPNPFNSKATLYISYPNNVFATNELIFFLHDVLGREVKRIESINVHQVEIKRENLPNGLYFYKVSNQKGIIGTGKLVIQ